MARQRVPAAPTEQYLDSLQTELVTLYSQQDEMIRRMRKVRELTQPVPLSSELRLVDVEVRDPTATDEIARVSSTLSVNPFSLHVEPVNQSDKAQTNATRREKFSEEVLRIAGNLMPGVDTFAAGIDCQVGDGGCWTKFLMNRDLWDLRYSITKGQFEDSEEEYIGEAGETKKRTITADAKYNRATEEAKKESGPPFVWMACDTLCVYPVYRGVELAEIMEIEERPKSAAFRQYRLREDKDGQIVPDELGQGSSQKTAGSVQVIHHWDKKWATVLIKGEHNGVIVKQWKHRYNRVPYFFAPGLMMGYWRNRKVGWSVSEAKRWLVEYRSYLWTLHAQVAARDALTPMVEETAPDVASARIGGDPTKPAQKEITTWNLREIVHLGAGKTLKPIQFPEVAKAIQEQIALVSEAISKLETPRVTSEIGSGLEGAGFAINQVLSEAKIRHNPLVTMFERMIEEIVKFKWRIIRDIIKETVWVYAEGDEGWIGMGPDELADTVRVKAELDPERPSAKLVESRYYHERVKEGTLDKDEAIERMGDNPDEVRLGRAVDRMREQPWYIKLQDRNVLEVLGMGDLLEEAEEIAQTGLMPGMQGGVPGMMGSDIVPDLGNLSVAPNGQGAAPMGAPNEMGMGTPVPVQSAAPGIQRLGG